jgi:osmotically-inducible protein OsmY
VSDAGDSPEYLVAHIRTALADRVGELGVQVTLTAGGVFLTGDVATAERHDAVAEVAGEVAGGRPVHNQTTVMHYPEPDDAEALP